jgi:putative ABC transport system permease protein
MVISKNMDWQTLISSKAIISAFLFSAGVEIIFGFYRREKWVGLNQLHAAL